MDLHLLEIINLGKVREEFLIILHKVIDHYLTVIEHSMDQHLIHNQLMVKLLFHLE
jgi:hypothetical protein